MIISFPDTFEREMKSHGVDIPERGTEDWDKLYCAFMEQLHKLNENGKINADGFAKHE